MTQVATYSCKSKGCKPWTGMTPQQYRAATGGAVCCPKCGRLARLVGVRLTSDNAIVEFRRTERMKAIEGLEITGLTVSPALASRIMETALEAGITYGFGYWASAVKVSRAKDGREGPIGYMVLVQHDEVGKVSHAIAGKNNGLLNAKGQQTFVVNSGNIKRAMIAMLNAGALVLDDDALDGVTCERIIQWACFGEEIYG